jgi:hypothetical protein
MLGARPENADLRTVYARGASAWPGSWTWPTPSSRSWGGKYNPTFFPEPGEYDGYVAEAKKAAAVKK